MSKPPPGFVELYFTRLLGLGELSFTVKLPHMALVIPKTEVRQRRNRTYVIKVHHLDGDGIIWVKEDFLKRMNVI